MIFGKKGSGKTTTLTKIALHEIKKGKKVYSTINIPGTEVFDIRKLGYQTFPPESVVLIDEVGMVWDARDFSKFPKEVRDWFRLQRHDKIRVYMFSQSFDVDKRIRDMTDELYLCQSFMRVFSIRRRILKKVGLSNGSQNASGVSNIVDDYKFDFPFFGGIQFTFIPRYVVYFDSYEPTNLAMIQGKHMDMNELQSAYLSDKKWLFGCFKIAFVKIVHSVKSVFIHD